MPGGDFVHRGACHCGAIRAELTVTEPADRIEVRACQCGFCTRHGALTVSDPAGRAVIDIEAAQFAPYTFATATSTSLICRSCGVYAGAILVDGDSTWSIVNARGMAVAAFMGRPGSARSYDDETAAERIARRKQKWTPTEIRLKL
jgi:hypothetical protein